jgi:hypothetical protein
LATCSTPCTSATEAAEMAADGMRLSGGTADM